MSSTIDEIKSKLDIVEFLSAYTKLQRAGKIYKGLSPFKSERTPSFVVYPDTQYFVDFSSGEKGDIFAFLMKKEGLTFSEALRELARRAGVTLESPSPEQKRNEDHETRLRNALNEAANYFHQLFLSAPQAKNCRDYVRQKRQLSDATINTWQIGYSLMDYQALMTHLSARGYSAQELIDAGLIIENDEGRRYDRFRGRLMIPIRDVQSRVIGFGSRSLDGSEPKYMNSPQTILFDKSKTLFGLDRARNAIRNGVNGLVGSVIVEGYMDVIGVTQAGYTNVVSSMGTALTEDQFKNLKRLHPTIVLALDPDAAGNRAVLRGVDVARESLERDDVTSFDGRGAIRHQSKLNADIRVAVMPDGKDPDEIVLESPERWRELIQKARPVTEHVIETALGTFDINDPRAKSEAVKAVAPIIQDLNDPVQRDAYVQMLARKLQLSARSIAQAIGLATQASAPPRKFTREPDAPSLSDSPKTLAAPAQKGVNLELHLVALLHHRPSLLMDINVALTRARLTVMDVNDFANPALRVGFEQLNRVALGAPTVIGDNNDDDWLALIADQPIQESGNEVTDELRAREEVIRIALRLREQNLQREQQVIGFAMQQAKEEADTQKLSTYNFRAQEIATEKYRAQKALRLRSAFVIDS